VPKRTAGFQHVGVGLDRQRREGGAHLRGERGATGGSQAGVNLVEHLGLEPGDVVAQGMVAELFGGGAPGRGRQTEHLAHEQVVVGDVFEAVPVGVQAQAHGAQREDLPEVQAGTAGGLLAGEDFGFQQGEDLGHERGLRAEPLEPGEDRRQLVAALQGQGNLFDGGDVKVWLGGETLARKGWKAANVAKSDMEAPANA